MFGFGDGSALRGPANPTIPNTLVYLRADLGLTLVSNKASLWADQSGNGNDASQGNAALRLTYVASSVGGKPGLTGTVSTVMTFASGLFTAGQQRWCLAVAKSANGAGGVVLATRTAAPICNIAASSINAGANFLPYSNGVDHVSETVPNFQPGGVGHNYEWVYTVGTPPDFPIDFSIDGAAQTTQAYAAIGDGTVTSDSGGVAAAYLANYFGGDAGFAGDICEVRAGTGSLSAPDRAAWRAYVNSYYGIVT